MKRFFFIAVILAASLGTVFGQVKISPEKVFLSERTGLRFPVSDKVIDTAKCIENLLSFDEIQLPKVYTSPVNRYFESMKMTENTADTLGVLLPASNADEYGVYYIRCIITADRYIKPEIIISGGLPFSVTLDDISLGSQKNIVKEGDKPKEVKKESALETGVHSIFIKVIDTPNRTKEARIRISLSTTDTFAESVHFTTDTKRTTTVDNLLYDEKISWVSMSPDGSTVLVAANQYDPETKSNKGAWYFFDREKGALLKTMRSGMYAGFQWLPEHDSYTFTETAEGKTTIYLNDGKTNSVVPLVTDIENFSGYTASPEGTELIFTISEKAKEKTFVKRYQTLPERNPAEGGSSELYSFSMKTGLKRKLTEFAVPCYMADISRDGGTLLLATSTEDALKRPYTYRTYYLFDMRKNTLDSLLVLYWDSNAQLSPDGKKILFLGGPSTFGEIGVRVNEGLIPNEYDGQLFLYDIASKNVEALSTDFDPAIAGAEWKPDGKEIFFTATDRSKIQVYRYSLAEKKFSKIPVSTDVVSGISYSDDKAFAVYYGSGLTTPAKVYTMDAARGNSVLLYDPSTPSYSSIRLGEAKQWSFTDSEGMNVEGQVYLPTGFDAQKKYPCIVFYYGGTSPVSEDFESRYPKNIWAANGYVVLILQPAGATGYGQNWSALHVNDWGTVTSRQIIEGTKAFCKENSFVDEKRLGCIGASYGGFMTMTLVTKTDIFAAAVSHAGISNLASYWGVGYWGYLYSAVATANSFPWNRKDVYVDNSPIFNADKVTTPIMLLHGNEDTNVPPGESMQFYTALRLLGKDVELIEIDGQNHHVMQPEKRKVWSKLILAYFDKYLKNQPDWWNAINSEQ